MSKPLARLSCQSGAMLATFHRDVSSMFFDYSKLFPEPFFAFLDHDAKSLGISVGFVVPSLLTRTAFLLATNNVNLLLGTPASKPVCWPSWHWKVTCNWDTPVSSSRYGLHCQRNLDKHHNLIWACQDNGKARKGFNCLTGNLWHSEQTFEKRWRQCHQRCAAAV